MNDSKQPSEIAREALRLLASRLMAPTPANYQSCYNEIAKLPNLPIFPEAQLRDLIGDLVARNERQVGELDRMSAAISRRSWQGLREALSAYIQAGVGSNASPGGPVDAVAVAVIPVEFAGKLARFIESVQPALGEENPRLVEVANEVRELLDQALVDVDAVQEALGRLTYQVLFAAEEQVEIKGSLLKLLHLVVENIGELTIDDRWLKGQIDGLLASIDPPLSLRRLDEMQRRLNDVMEKQGRAKSRSVEAQIEMRQMLAEFIERLASINRSSSDFEARIEATAREVEQVESVTDLRPLLDSVISATHAMVEESARSRGELQSLQEKVKSTEAELVVLHQELDSASMLARHDPLTDVLNRKGLEEALCREIAGMRRKNSALSLCLLDIDNFKKLNDRLGHVVGDAALVHLANVVRNNLRPSDTLARYGGEEFVILMPDTSLDHGIEAMVRLQRELTKAFFLSGSEKILITFSAGVAQMAIDESSTEAIQRADQAMYLAKRAGKNRVFGA